MLPLGRSSLGPPEATNAEAEGWVEDYNAVRMDPRAARHFFNEIAFQCKLARKAFQEVRLAVSAEVNDAQFWADVQSLLAAAANISKILWPQRKQSADRGTDLRNVLAVKEDSPLQARTVRNHLEHFDERLESWAADPVRLARNVVVDRAFLDASGIHIEGEGGQMFRKFDPIAMTVSFHRDEVHLPTLIDAIEALERRTAVALNQETSASAPPREHDAETGTLPVPPSPT